MTNLGNFSVEIFISIIHTPQTAILGVGKIKEEPAVYNREIKIRSIIRLSFSFVDRIVDGVLVVKILHLLKNI